MFSEFLKNIVETLLIFLAVTGIVLLGADWILQTYFTSLSENLTAISNQQLNKNTDLKNINGILLQTEKLQVQYTLWVEKIITISDAVPPGVVLTQLTLDAKNKTLLLGGVAETRENLLALQKNLEALPLLSGINIPISQLSLRSNLPFSIIGTLE